MRFVHSIASTAFAFSAANALSLDVNSADSIKSAAKTVAKGVLDLYNGDKPGEIPGIFDDPYYWWSGGAVWDAMIDYWYLTGDDQYNTIVEQALQWQRGPGEDYLPPNQTKTIGNDDQSTWAHAALTAAERSFPSSNNATAYLTLAKNVFDEQATRWDDKTCSGGLRWQIFTFNNGYNYKNSLSNGQFFELAARLAHFTSNKTYSDWTEKVYNWTESIGLIGSGGQVYDGSDVTSDCSSVNHIEWSNNIGTFLYGSALMYNITNGGDTWQNRTKTHLAHLKTTFAKSNTLFEVACESNGKCDVDQFFFKGQLARDLARTAQIAPFTSSDILPLLQNSAKAAASIGCAKSGEACTWNWNSEAGGESSLGSQYSALQVIQANLVAASKAPATSTSFNFSTGPSGTQGGGGSASAEPTKGEGGRFSVQSGALTSLLIGLAVFSLL